MIDADEIDTLIGIALRAGEGIIGLDQRTIVAKAKPDGSPVTQADLAANEIITTGLAEKFSGIPVISEESVPSRDVAGGRYVFLVDPLDGTKEFLRGALEFTINIALLDGSDPVAGVIYAPALQVIYTGARGRGARRATVANGAVERWQSLSAVRPSGSLRLLVSHSHSTAETRQFIDRYTIGHSSAIGSSLKFCLIAAGEADLYPRMGPTMEWDTAAGDAILHAAGGSVRTLDGELLKYRRGGAGATRSFENPWFVAAGAFDPFDKRWQSGNAATTGAAGTAGPT